MKVLVVGGGILGVAAAHALAIAGARVELLEGAALAAGASGGSGGMVRAFHADPGLADLARRSLPTWQDFAAHVGGSCAFQRTGSVYIAPASRGEAVSHEVRRLAAAGVRIELLDAAAARQRFPGWTFADDELVVHEPDAGWADVPLAVESYAAAARAAGAVIRQGQRVTALRTDGDRVRGVVTAEGELAADAVVLAAGLGAPALLAPLALDAGLYAKAIQIVRLDGAPDPGHPHPCYLSLATRSYGRATAPGTSWVGVASDAAYDPALPLDEAEAASAAALAGARLPALAGRARTAGLRTGDLYTRGAIGTWGNAPGVAGLALALGFGGTGFKVAPAVAADVAAAVLRGAEARV